MATKVKTKLEIEKNVLRGVARAELTRGTTTICRFPRFAVFEELMVAKGTTTVMLFDDEGRLIATVTADEVAVKVVAE